jgi:agmatine deiminase
MWLAWPHNLETWPGRFERVPAAFAAMIRCIAEVIPVRLLAEGLVADAARRHLEGVAPVEIIPHATNDCWIRDYGPTFVQDTRDGSIVGVNWRYNAWGGKYSPWDQDAAAAETICSYAGVRRIDSPLCCEGGALETDGGGRLLTTPDCLVTPTRNPHWDADQVAQELYQRLGVTEILWLDGGGLEGDDTDGHIDQLARFVSPTAVVAAVCEDADDPNHAPLEENYRQLRVWGRQTEPGVEVHRLPLPPARHLDGQRVPESYCNFLIVGGRRVLVPRFGCQATDEHAAGLLGDLMPALEIVSLDASDLAWGLGAFHCASQQQPRSGEGAVSS